MRRRRKKRLRPEIHGFSFEALVSYAKTVPIEEISFLREAFSMNLALLEEGLRDARTVVAHHHFLRKKEKHFCPPTRGLRRSFSARARSRRGFWARGAPAMSITGSGSHGIIAVMPAVCRSEGGRIRRRGAFAGLAA